MKHIKITYSTWTEEDLEFGETDNKGFENEEGISCEPDKYDKEDGLTAIDLAFRVLKDNGAWEPSCSRFFKDTWYSSCSEDYRNGGHTDYGFHLYGFSELEEQEIFDRVKKI